MRSRRAGSPSRWWLVVPLPVAGVISLAVVLVAAALDPRPAPPRSVNTRLLTAVADAYVDARTPQSTFGRAASLRTGPTARSYLRFVVPLIAGTVTRARLRVWAEGVRRGRFSVRVVRNPAWEEATISAGHRPWVGPVVATSRPFAGTGWVAVDVTRLVSGPGPVNLALVSRRASAATYGSREGDHPPELAVSSTRDSVASSSPAASLAAVVTDVLGATRYRLQAHDDRHRPLASLRIAQVTRHRYVGVYQTMSHGTSAVQVGISRDLLHWTWKATLDRGATQPRIAAMRGGAFQLAVASRPRGGGRRLTRLYQYATLRHLLSARADRTSPVQAGCARTWTRAERRALGAALAAERASGGSGETQRVRYRGLDLALLGARIGQDRTWHVFLYDLPLRLAHPLKVHSPRGSASFTDPAATFVRAPSGAPAVAVTLRVERPGSAPGEPGELVFYREVGRPRAALPGQGPDRGPIACQS